jgi:hypothetical protein
VIRWIERYFMDAVLVVGLAAACGFAGLFAGIAIACLPGWGGNLCGLVGFLGTGPLGFITGIVIAAVMLRRRYVKSHPRSAAPDWEQHAGGGAP